MSEDLENKEKVELEKSRNEYLKPFPKETKVSGVQYENDAHVGPYKGAVDFSVEIGTPALAPFTGRVIQVVDEHERYGDTPDNEPFSNYITIQHPNGEFSQVVHLAKDSALVKSGNVVQGGQQIAVSGNSGWMTEPHLHFFVFRNFPDGSFKGLKIQFKE